VVEQGAVLIAMLVAAFLPSPGSGCLRGLEFELRGDGRRYKLAVACADGLGRLIELIPGGLR